MAKKRTKHFVKLRNGFVDHLQYMSEAPLKVYLAFLMLCDYDGKMSVTQTELARITGLTRKSVSSGLDWLINPPPTKHGEILMPYIEFDVAADEPECSYRVCNYLGKEQAALEGLAASIVGRELDSDEKIKLAKMTQAKSYRYAEWALEASRTDADPISAAAARVLNPKSQKPIDKALTLVKPFASGRKSPVPSPQSLLNATYRSLD